MIQREGHQSERASLKAGPGGTSPVGNDPTSTGRQFARPALVVVAALSSAAALLVYWLVAMKATLVRDVDSAVLSRAIGLTKGRPWVVVVLKGLSRATVPVDFIVLASLVALVLVGLRRPVHAAFLVVTVLGGMQLAPLLKGLVERPRPSVLDPVASAGGYSFPSGHALSATVVALAIVIVLRPMLRSGSHRTLVVAAVTLVVAVCLARVVLLVHYVSDVLAGVLIGTAWVTICAAVALGVLRREVASSLRPGAR